MMNCLNIKIRPAFKTECSLIADIHKCYLPGSFLAILGKNFLKLLYLSLAGYKEGALFVAENQSGIIGFVSGVKNTSDFFRFFKNTQGIKAGILLLPALFKKGTAARIWEIFCYGKKTGIDTGPEAELLSIAVNAQWQGKGVSKKLFSALSDFFRDQGVDSFKIVAGKDLLRAHSFYSKMGCLEKGTVEVHKDEVSKIFQYTIKNDR